MSYSPSWDPEYNDGYDQERQYTLQDEEYDRYAQEELDSRVDLDMRRLAGSTGINPNEDMRPLEVKHAA